jgi:hypothetical protein
MDKDPAASRYEQALVSQSRPPLLLSDDQFNRLLEVFERRRDLVDSLHTVTKEQEPVVEAFKRAAIGMGIKGFGVPAKQVIRNTAAAVIVLVPDEATLARVYARSGVREVTVKGRAGSFVVDGLKSSDRVGRVEFFDEHGVLLEVTGGEAAPDPYRLGTAG